MSASTATRSPTFTPQRLPARSPRRSITPSGSCPGTSGKRTGITPAYCSASLPQMPHASTRRSALSSSISGSGSSRSSSRRGPVCTTARLVRGGMARGVYSGRSPPDQPAAEPCQRSRAGANGPRREEIAAAVAIAFLLFLLYARGACPTIYVGDSGELVAAVHTLGIPHPTGYPLYVLLGKLWTLALPFGSIAWRMSVFSAVCAAAACASLFVLLRGFPAHSGA